jgi:hypothetical protein
MSDKERPYDPDNPHLSAQTPDDVGFMNPMTLSAVNENEQLKRELAKEKALRKQVQHDNYDNRTDEEIAQEVIDTELYNVQEFLMSDEGEAFLREDITRHYTQGQDSDPEWDVLKTYGSKQRQRMRDEQNWLDKADSEDE